MVSRVQTLFQSWLNKMQPARTPSEQQRLCRQKPVQRGSAITLDQADRASCLTARALQLKWENTTRDKEAEDAVCTRLLFHPRGWCEAAVSLAELGVRDTAVIKSKSADYQEALALHILFWDWVSGWLGTRNNPPASAWTVARVTDLYHYIQFVHILFKISFYFSGCSGAYRGQKRKLELEELWTGTELRSSGRATSIGNLRVISPAFCSYSLDQ